MSKTVIEIKNLSKKYIINRQKPHSTFRQALINLYNKTKRKEKEEFWALKNINLKVREGEILGVIGRNGAGKSTLLKILTQITPPTTGVIKIHGRVSSLLEVGTGFNPELSGRENIYLNGAILGMKRAEIKNKFDEIVAFSEIDKFLDTPVKRYSSGMYVRLAFAVAAHLEPEILLIDEVLSVGDTNFQKKCMGKMEDVAKGGRTVLFVSHNLGAIRQLCTSCVLLEKGRIVAQSNPQDIVERYLVEKTVKKPVFKQAHKAHKKMNLREVLLNPHKKMNSNNVNYDEDILIRIEYEVNSKVNDANVWMAIQTSDGTMAFTTADYDLDPKMKGTRLPGYYRSDVKLPKKWLNTGQYMIVVGLVNNNPFEVFDRKETIMFNIIDNGTTPNAFYKDGTRRGVLQPFLKWENIKVK